MESSGQKRLGEVTELANQEGDYVFKLLPIVRLPGAKCNRVWKWVAYEAGGGGLKFLHAGRGVCQLW